ncbi:MAG: DNA polymerase III subunit delta [Clostridia bacterium]|nr:DNA polymerase III subunit delta [Clostridia bacterium]
MKYIDFKKFTDENGAMPIYLFEGEEAYFREKGEALLKARFLQEPTLDYISFDGASVKGDGFKSVVDAWNCFPFVSERRVVRLTEFYPTEKDFDFYLKSAFENPPKDGLLLIVNSAKPKAGCAALSKKSNVTYVDCGKSDEETIKKWIYLTCKREGVYADGVTCGKLAAYCTLDMARISKETEKLLCYCQAEQLDRITDELVDTLVYPDAEYKIYELSNAVARKNYAAFTTILKELLTKGFNEISLLSALSAYFKDLYEISLLRGSDRELAATLGIKEYAVKKKREQVQQFPKGALLKTYEGMYGAISGIKCGKMTPDSALKTATARLFFENSRKNTD